MQGKRFRWLAAAPLLGLMATSAVALGQGARPWVDPPHPTRTVSPAPVSSPEPARSTSGAVDAVPLPSPEATQISNEPTTGAGARTEPTSQPEEAAFPAAPPGEDNIRDQPESVVPSKRKALGEGQSPERSTRSVRAQEPRKVKRHSGRSVARARNGASPFAKLFGPPRRGANVINTTSATR
jgi:hypothetical protein